MHLLLAESLDVTADMIVDGLGDRVVRVNNDRLADQEIQITQGGFSIRDSFGREVNNQNLQTLILRKFRRRPLNASDEQVYAFREHTRALESLLDWITWVSPEKVPINPFHMYRVSKFNMCDVAKKYFSVPAWAFSNRPSNSGLKDAVLKNLCGMPFSDSKKGEESPTFVYVQPVDTEELADGWPWYLQEKIDARFDLTVAYIAGKTFGMKLDRSSFEGVDWRKHIGTTTGEHWVHVSLPGWFHEKIDKYMLELGLDYGRLDFLASQDDLSDVKFLEVNPHGQWAWMDLQKNKGIYSTMMEFLTTQRPKRKDL
jgi:hypothetical protein